MIMLLSKATQTVGTCNVSNSIHLRDAFALKARQPFGLVSNKEKQKQDVR
jgi:hypothetical protein